MTFDSISGPRQRRSLQKLEIVIGSAFGTVFLSNLSWEESCACVDFVGGFGNCKLNFSDNLVVFCAKKKIIG